MILKPYHQTRNNLNHNPLLHVFPTTNTVHMGVPITKAPRQTSQGLKNRTFRYLVLFEITNRSFIVQVSILDGSWCYLKVAFSKRLIPMCFLILTNCKGSINRSSLYINLLAVSRMYTPQSYPFGCIPH